MRALIRGARQTGLPAIYARPETPSTALDGVRVVFLLSGYQDTDLVTKPPAYGLTNDGRMV